MFKIGDVVRLKSGGMPMTVIAVDDQGDIGIDIHVQWYDVTLADYKTDVFAPECLGKFPEYSPAHVETHSWVKGDQDVSAKGGPAEVVPQGTLPVVKETDRLRCSINTVHELLEKLEQRLEPVLEPAGIYSMKEYVPYCIPLAQDLADIADRSVSRGAIHRIPSGQARPLTRV